jgi:3D (Asp-Asp-Asp) domain-containing protein
MNLLSRLAFFSILAVSVVTPVITAEAEDKALDYLSLNNDIIFIQQQQTQQILKGVNQKIKRLESAILAQKNANSTIKYRLEVEATAYTSHTEQTNSKPTITAWGDHLKPTTKSIAVSRDLLTEYGLKYRTKVTIKGLSGEFLVLDKMHKRWRQRIDIYMGMKRNAALHWGLRKVELCWKQEET